jgi:hypothetical protein
VPPKTLRGKTALNTRNFFAEFERRHVYGDRSARVSTPQFYPWLAPLFNDSRFTALEYKVAHSAISSPLDVKS